MVCLFSDVESFRSLLEPPQRTILMLHCKFMLGPRGAPGLDGLDGLRGPKGIKGASGKRDTKKLILILNIVWQLCLS